MDFSSVGGTALTPEAQASYAVGCIKMAQESTKAVESIILDTVEISAEAMRLFLSERDS